MAMSDEHGTNFGAFHWEWSRLQMSEKIIEWYEKSLKKNMVMSDEHRSKFAALHR